MKLLHRVLLLMVTSLSLVGCASTPKVAPDMRAYSTPTEGTAGIYFYQWKTGMMGAMSDVKFVLNDEVLGRINTGEWLYFEVEEGTHEVRLLGGIFQQARPLEFVKGQNYFFRGALLNSLES
ncbi:hypothetical protein AU15_20905 [Marinobacter salarius]|uniref:DUF2846 domain-containing protein n=1 Tax=Marinobacter salarius TaxID=1420917 RepID=W5YX05_9GAMM|nr:hypothetical protein AU15_20905 [Marinobacter salarius]